MDHDTATQTTLKVPSHREAPPMWAYGLAILFFVFIIGLTYAFVYYTKYNLRVMRQEHAEQLQMRGTATGSLSVGTAGRGRRFAHESASESVGEIVGDGGSADDVEGSVALINDVDVDTQHITKRDKGKNYELLE